MCFSLFFCDGKTCGKCILTPVCLIRTCLLTGPRRKPFPTRRRRILLLQPPNARRRPPPPTPTHFHLIYTPRQRPPPTPPLLLLPLFPPPLCDLWPFPSLPPSPPTLVQLGDYFARVFCLGRFLAFELSFLPLVLIFFFFGPVLF